MDCSRAIYGGISRSEQNENIKLLMVRQDTGSLIESIPAYNRSPQIEGWSQRGERCCWLLAASIAAFLLRAYGNGDQTLPRNAFHYPLN